MDKQGKSMMPSGSSIEAAQLQQRKMIPVKNVEITAEAYEKEEQKQEPRRNNKETKLPWETFPNLAGATAR